jgi:type I restriction enzyme S subunit
MSPDALIVSEREDTALGEPAIDLPDGWNWATLGEVAALNPPTAFDGLAHDAEIPFIPMAAVAEETGNIDSSRHRPLTAVRKGYVRFQEDDVIFAKITPCMENGKIAPVLGIAGSYAAGSTEFHVLRPRCVDTKYLWYWLVRRAFRQEAERNMSGSAGQLRVPVDYLRAASIPLAPFSEQRRIVGRIDELFAEIAQGEAALERARRDLETWRRALLKAAVTGELTRDWREINAPTETGVDLLARLRIERKAAVSLNARNRRSPSVGSLDTASLPVLPHGWAWARLGELGDVTGGLTKNPDRVGFAEKLPFLRVANVQMGSLDMAEIKEIGVRPEERHRLLLALNDLLIVEGNGSIEQIGRCALWKYEIHPCVHQNHIIKARFSEPVVAAWALRWLLSPSGRTAIKAVASSTSGLHTLSISKIQNLPIPVPPLEEIRPALRLVDEALAAAADAQDEIETMRQDKFKLRQAILKAAFNGRLVPQDPTDEPAAVLLSRIRETNGGPAPRRRPRRVGEATQGAFVL